MKFSILLTLALSYTTLSSAQNFRRDNADKAEQLTREFAKLTKDSPCENNAQACVENQFAQCVNGKFQLNSCGGGELKCVVLPLVNKAGTSITCSTEADRLARLADARGEPPPNQGKSKNGILPPDSEQDNGKNGKLPPNEGDGKDENTPPELGKGKNGKLPPNEGDGKDENTPPELGKGKNGKSPPDNLCKCPGNDNGKDGNDNGKDDNDNGKDGNDNGKDGNDNGKDGNDNDTENGDGNDDGKDNGDGNENDGIDNGDGNGKDENDNGKDENDNAKDGNVPDNQDTPKNPDNVQTPPANGDGNLADIRRQNAAEARALQEKFDQLKPDDECNDNEVACVENKFAQCSGGKFALTDCASGTICAALPLVLKKGTTVACTTEADRDARLKQAESNTK